MSETKVKHRTVPPKRIYESESPRLLSLRLIAAPNPKDDLSDAELAAIAKEPRHSPE